MMMPAPPDRCEPAPLAILYRDEHLIAIHKPSGLLVHRSQLDRHETRFAVQMLRDQIGRHVHPAHRLDRGTSGILLFALDRDIARALGARFTAQQVEKRYLAVVRGHPPLAGTLDHPLRRLHDDHEDRLAAATADEVQAAVTHFRRLAIAELPHAVDRYPSSRYALLELRPETGRRHQIRRHLKHAAHPVIGDATYGKGRHNRLFTTLFGNQRLLLACVELGFTHPVSGVPLRLQAAPADDFARVLAALGWTPALTNAATEAG